MSDRGHQSCALATGASVTRAGGFDRWFTVDEAALVLGTSPATVRRLMREKLIAHQRVSARRTVIRESALRAYLESVTFGPKP